MLFPFHGQYDAGCRAQSGTTDNAEAAAGQRNASRDILQADGPVSLGGVLFHFAAREAAAVVRNLDAAAIIHKAMPETHIVFLTAFDRFDYAVGAMRAGGTDYLVKPFDSAQITACLRKLNLLPESRPAVRGDKPGNTFCTQFSVWLEHHYMQDVSLDQAAEAMGMSSFYFSRFFRTSYNQTFLEYLTAYRIDRAVELLQQTDIPVREIAVRVGYTDANYFTKVFKRHLGVTPTEYRNHNAN